MRIAIEPLMDRDRSAGLTAIRRRGERTRRGVKRARYKVPVTRGAPVMIRSHRIC